MDIPYVRPRVQCHPAAQYATLGFGTRFTAIQNILRFTNAQTPMKVLVLGGGVIGVTSAWYLRRAGHEVTVVDRQAGAGAGNQPGQWRPGVVGRRHAVGRARHSAQGAEMDAASAFAAGAAPASRPGHVGLAVAHARQLHLRALRRQPRAHAAAVALQPRMPGSAAARHRHPIRRAHHRHTRAVPHHTRTR